MSSASTINGNEKVVRILHRDWVVDGVVMINAFTLRLAVIISHMLGYSQECPAKTSREVSNKISLSMVIPRCL